MNHNYDEAGGSAYTPTVEFTYDSLDRITTITDMDGVVRKYYYADTDGVNNDGDGGTDETGEWGAQLVKVIVDYGTGSELNLTQVEYEYHNTHNRVNDTFHGPPDLHRGPPQGIRGTRLS